MAFEGLRDRWEHMAPRERTLASVFAVAVVVTLFAFVGITINDGLDEIAAHNDLRRDALAALELIRLQKERGSEDAPKATIPDDPVDLPAYLEDIAKEVGITIPNYQPQPQTQRGKFDEIAVNIDIREVTVQELADFVSKVETRNAAVVLTRLHLERSFRDQERLRKASMTVATYAPIARKNTKGKRKHTGGDDAGSSAGKAGG